MDKLRVKGNAKEKQQSRNNGGDAKVSSRRAGPQACQRGAKDLQWPRALKAITVGGKKDLSCGLTWDERTGRAA